MRVPKTLAAATVFLSFTCLAVSGEQGSLQGEAQNNVQTSQPDPHQTVPPSATPTEPGTGNAQVAPASKAPRPEQKPDVRLDSKPHTDIDASVDSSATPMDLGLGADPAIDLGHDIVPVTPPGMASRSVPGNPRMVYFSLPQRFPQESAGERISPDDSATLVARQAELVHAAASRGFDLKQPGWMYQQAVCPVIEPGSGALVGVPVAGNGSILLHFTRTEPDGRFAAFTAVVPRASDQPVRASAVIRRGVEGHGEFLTKKLNSGFVKETLPPTTLYSNLQPVSSWIAAAACLAEIGGATVDIPNETFLSEDILTTPVPTLRLLLNGEREVIFTDRVDDSRYVIWNEQVSRRGVFRSASHDQFRITPRPVTNPPVPQPRLIADVPQPPSHISPEPPSPLSGDKQ